MDLTNIQKYVDNELSRYKISRDVTETKNLVKDRLAGADIERSEYFKTLLLSIYYHNPLVTVYLPPMLKKNKVVLRTAMICLTSCFAKSN